MTKTVRQRLDEGGCAVCPECFHTWNAEFGKNVSPCPKCGANCLSSDKHAYHAATGELIRQGLDREWVEEHLVEASWKDGNLHYTVEPDKPAEYIIGDFTWRGLEVQDGGE